MSNNGRSSTLDATQSHAVNALRDQVLSYFINASEEFYKEHPELRLKWSFELSAYPRDTYQGRSPHTDLVGAYFERCDLNVSSTAEALLIWAIKGGQRINKVWRYEDIQRLVYEPSKLWKRADEIVEQFAKVEVPNEPK